MGINKKEGIKRKRKKENGDKDGIHLKNYSTNHLKLMKLKQCLADNKSLINNDYDCIIIIKPFLQLDSELPEIRDFTLVISSSMVPSIQEVLDRGKNDFPVILKFGNHYICQEC